jgi:hypothetical protein
VDTPRNIFPDKNLPCRLQDRSWWQKPRHTLLGRALEAFRKGQSGHGGASLRRLTPTKHTAGPLGLKPVPQSKRYPFTHFSMKANLKTKVVLLLCIFPILYLSSCKPKQVSEDDSTTILTLNISKAFDDQRESLLSEIANEVSYIKLETNQACLLSGIKNPFDDVKFTKDRVFINDKNSIYSFGLDGKFIASYGTKGRGPGEYISIDNFTVLPKDSLVAIFSGPNQKVFLYSFDNLHRKEILIDFWPTSMYSISDKALVFANPKGGRSLTNYYALSIIDLKGKLENRLLYYGIEKEVEKKNKLGLNPNCRFYNLYDTISYWEYQYDTIYRIYDYKTIRPIYYIESGQDKLPFEFILENGRPIDERDGYVKIWSLIESKDYLFLRVGYKTSLRHVFFEKNTHDTWSVLHYNAKNFPIVKFINDIDYGPSFWPAGIVVGNKVFSTFNGYEFYNQIKNDSNLVDSIKDKNIWLHQAIVDSKSNDNPIIMIVSLK